MERDAGAPSHPIGTLPMFGSAGWETTDGMDSREARIADLDEVERACEEAIRRLVAIRLDAMRRRTLLTSVLRSGRGQPRGGGQARS